MALQKKKERSVFPETEKSEGTLKMVSSVYSRFFVSGTFWHWWP
jgi:hypothetical protein